MGIITQIFRQKNKNSKWHIMRNKWENITYCNRDMYGKDMSTYPRLRQAKKTSNICQNCLNIFKDENGRNI